MDPDKAKLAAALLPDVLPIAREAYRQRTQRQLLEEQKEYEREVLEARKEADNTSVVEPQPTADTSTGTPSQPSGGADVIDRAIDDIQSETECGICTQILESLRSLPEEEQAKALAEYGRFQQAIEAGDEDEARAVLSETPTLRNVVESEFNLAPPQ